MIKSAQDQLRDLFKWQEKLSWEVHLWLWPCWKISVDVGRIKARECWKLLNSIVNSRMAFLLATGFYRDRIRVSALLASVVPFLTLPRRVVSVGARSYGPALSFFLLRTNCSEGKVRYPCSRHVSITENIAAQTSKAWPERLNNLLYLSNVPRIISYKLYICSHLLLLHFISQMKLCVKERCYLSLASWKISKNVSVLFYHQIVFYLNIY